MLPEETTSQSGRTLRPGRRGSLCSLFLGPLPPGLHRPWTRTWVLRPLPRSEHLSCPACVRKGCAHSWPAAFPSHLNNPCVPAVHQLPNIRGMERNQPYCQSPFQGLGHLWCQKCPGGKLCNQTKLDGPTSCLPGHSCPGEGPAIHPPSHVEKLPSALPASLGFCKGRFW